MATLEGVNAALASAIQRMLAEAPFRIGIESGFRTRAQQQQLYDDYKAGRGNLAAAPGRSNHEHGNAVDLDYPGERGSAEYNRAVQWVRQNATRFGIHFPVHGEPWHAELVDGPGNPGAGLDDDDARLNTGNPEDALFARLDAIRNAIRGETDTTAIQAPTPQMRTETTTMTPTATTKTPFPLSRAQGAVQVNYNPKGGVDQWRPLVVQALQLVGEAPSEANVAMTLRRMKQESGGNPTIVNNWDVNAKRGTPSIGLMQVIKPTFDKYAGEFQSRGQTDPLANLVASMRYAKSRYGSLAAAYLKRGGY